MTKKRRRFISAYLKSFNATRAAIEAGYSQKTAAQIGYDLLRIPQISDEIKRHLDAEAMSAAEVLHRLARIARGDLVSGRRDTKDGTMDEHDHIRALENLGKAHALFVDKQLIQTLGGLEIIDDQAPGNQAPAPASPPGGD